MTSSNNESSLTKKVMAHFKAHFNPANVKDDFQDKLQKKKYKVLSSLIATINETTQKINVEAYHRLLDATLTPDSTTKGLTNKQIQRITGDLKILQDIDMLQFLPMNNGLTFKEIIQEYNKVQNRILELKNELPKMLDSIRAALALQELGLFSFADLKEKCLGFGEECLWYSVEKDQIIEHISALEYCANGLIGTANVLHGEDLHKTPIVRWPSKSTKQETAKKKTDLKKKGIECNGGILMCRLKNHSIPFCEGCGWQSSWRDYFAKRGVFIEQVENDTSKNIWVNNVEMNKE